VGALAAAALGFQGAAAWGQTSCGEAQFQRGNELRRGAHDQEALEQFRQAWEACHSPRAQAQMALAEAALGRWLDADRHLAAVLGGAADPWVTRNRAQLESVQVQVSSHLGQLEVLGGPPGAEVLLEGRPAGALPLREPLHVVAGSATLLVRAPGYAPVTRMVMVTPGQLVRESIELVPLPVASPQPIGGAVAVDPPRDAVAPPIAQPTAGGTQRTLAWVVGGVGVLALGGGVAATLIGSGADADYADRNCMRTVNASGGAVFTDASCRDAYDTSANAQTLSLVGYIAGGALVATSLVLFLTAPSSAPRPMTAGLRGCGMGPGAVGMACEFGF